MFYKSYVHSFCCGSPPYRARRAVKDDEDSCETWPLARLIGLCCLTGGLIAAAVTALLVLGVRL